MMEKAHVARVNGRWIVVRGVFRQADAWNWCHVMNLLDGNFLVPGPKLWVARDLAKGAKGVERRRGSAESCNTPSA